MPIAVWILLCLVGIALLMRWLGRVGPAGYLEVHPHHAAWLESLGLRSVEEFLALSGVIVSGHADRNVARLQLGDLVVYLKREHRVPWGVRRSSWWAGFGACSRSLREARALQALEREGFAAPQWLAAGESCDGRAFLLLLEVPEARELRSELPTLSPNDRLRRLCELARLLAQMHTSGLVHPDLYAGHVLVEGTSGRLIFLDWARCQRRSVVALRERARALAALDSTCPAEELSPRERWFVLRVYLRASAEEVPVEQHARILRWLDHYRHQLTHRRHVIEKSQPRRAAAPQTWTPIEGEELCVSGNLQEVLPGDPHWLSLRQPSRSRWLATPSGDPVRLERTTHHGVALWSFLAWLRGRGYVAPEQARAHLLLRLERYHVPVPQVLAMGQRWQGANQVEAFLLTRPPSGTLPVEHWLRRCDSSAERSQIVRALGALIHQLHGAGCYVGSPAGWGCLSVQVQGQTRVVLNDVAGLRACRGFDERQAHSDLQRCCVLLAEQGCDEAERSAFTGAYAGAVATVPSANQVASSGAEIMTSDTPRIETTEPARGSLWSRLWHGARRLWHLPEWANFVGTDWIATIMDRPVTDRYSSKQGRSSGRMILPAVVSAESPDGEPLRIYLKRHYHLPWWDRLRALLFPGGRWSPAVQEMHHLEKARRLGVPVPEVIAAGEFIGPGLRLQSFLAVRELTGMLPLHEAIPLAAQRMSPEAFTQWKRGLIQEMARLCRLLHDRNWYHKDLYLCHFYIDESYTHAAPDGAPEGWRNRVFLIDLHRLGHHPWTWAIWQMKDLAQLLYSSEVEGVTDRDRLAFWRAYQGPTPRHRWDSFLRWCVVFKWRRYRSHNLRHAARRRLQLAEAVQPEGKAQP